MDCYREVHSQATPEFRTSDNKIKPKIALLGLSFKANIDDLRESPAEYIVSELHKKYDNQLINVVEPNKNKHKNFNIVSLKYALKNSDLFFVLVGHDEFKGIKKIINNSKFYSFIRND